MADGVHIEDRTGVRWITLDQAESRNGLTVEMTEVIANALSAASADDSVRVVVIYGANGAFCSGLDLKAAMAAGISNPAPGIAAFQHLARTLRGVLKPTIAAVDGAAAGFGADLAFGCDLRLVSEAARFGERFVRINLVPDGGGTFLLPRLVGLAKAFELIYTGRMVGSEEAERIGLANQVFPVEGFVDAVHEWAGRLAVGPPMAYARAKRAILQNQGDFDDALKVEFDAQLELLASQDFMEGVQAFLGKRPPPSPENRT